MELDSGGDSGWGCALRCIRTLNCQTHTTSLLVEGLADKRLYVLRRLDVRDMRNKDRQEVAQEVRQLGSLRHVFVLSCYGSFEEKSYINLLTDYAENGSLRHLVKTAESEIIMQWVIQLALALEHTHVSDLLHHDVTLDSVFVNSKGVLKLGDFGLKSILNRFSESERRTATTPYFTAPEVRVGLPYQTHSDIWAFANVCKELLKHAQTVAESPQGGSLPATHILEEDFFNLKRVLDSMASPDPRCRPKLADLLTLPCVQSRAPHLPTVLRSELAAYTTKQKANPGTTTAANTTQPQAPHSAPQAAKAVVSHNPRRVNQNAPGGGGGVSGVQPMPSSASFSSSTSSVQGASYHPISGKMDTSTASSAGSGTPLCPDLRGGNTTSPTTTPPTPMFVDPTAGGRKRPATSPPAQQRPREPTGTATPGSSSTVLTPSRPAPLPPAFVTHPQASPATPPQARHPAEGVEGPRPKASPAVSSPPLSPGLPGTPSAAAPLRQAQPPPPPPPGPSLLRAAADEAPQHGGSRGSTAAPASASIATPTTTPTATPVGKTGSAAHPHYRPVSYGTPLQQGVSVPLGGGAGAWRGGGGGGAPQKTPSQQQQQQQQQQHLSLQQLRQAKQQERSKSRGLHGHDTTAQAMQSALPARRAAAGPPPPPTPSGSAPGVGVHAMGRRGSAGRDADVSPLSAPEGGDTWMQDAKGKLQQLTATLAAMPAGAKHPPSPTGAGSSAPCLRAAAGLGADSPRRLDREREAARQQRHALSPTGKARRPRQQPFATSSPAILSEQAGRREAAAGGGGGGVRTSSLGRKPAVTSGSRSRSIDQREAGSSPHGDAKAAARRGLASVHMLRRDEEEKRRGEMASKRQREQESLKERNKELRSKLTNAKSRITTVGGPRGDFLKGNQRNGVVFTTLGPSLDSPAQEVSPGLQARAEGGVGVGVPTPRGTPRKKMEVPEAGGSRSEGKENHYAAPNRGGPRGARAAKEKERVVGHVPVAGVAVSGQREDDTEAMREKKEKARESRDEARRAMKEARRQHMEEKRKHPGNDWSFEIHVSSHQLPEELPPQQGGQGAVGPPQTQPILSPRPLEPGLAHRPPLHTDPNLSSVSLDAPPSPSSPPEPQQFQGRQSMHSLHDYSHDLHGEMSRSAPMLAMSDDLAPDPLVHLPRDAKRKDYALPSDPFPVQAPSALPIPSPVRASPPREGDAPAAEDTTVRSKVSSKIECLRESLEEQLGTDTFFSAYQRLKVSDGRTDESLFEGLGVTDAKSRVAERMLYQLVELEDLFYG